MKQGDLLFVYGTLRKGERADLSNKLGTRFMGEDAISGALHDTGYGFPGVKDVKEEFSPGACIVKGDVFRLENETVIAILDAYENYPQMYDRKVVKSAKGRDVWVYTYNYDVPEDSKISGGDWRFRRGYHNYGLEAA